MAPDKYYPSVDLDFITEKVTQSGMLEDNGVIEVGSTITYVQSGSKAIYRRTTLVRQIEPGQVCFEQAMGLAYKFRFLPELLEWLEEHKSWKEGAYISEKKSMSK